MVAENKVIIPGSDRLESVDPPRFGARVAEQPSDPSKQKTVTVYMRSLTPDALNALSVLASEHRLAMRTDTPGNAIQLTGRLGDLQDAFVPATEHVYHAIDENVEHDARTGSLVIPEALARACAAPGQPLQVGDIAVLGLDDRPIAAPRFKQRTSFPRASGPQALFPRQVAKAYGLPANCGDGSGVVMGIISLGGGYSAKDLQAYCSKILCDVPDVEWIPVDGGGNNPGNDADTENGLDINVMVDILAYAFGPHHKAKILVAGASNTDQGFANGLSTLIQRGAGNIGDSWGSPEVQWTAQSRAVMQNILQGTKTRVFPASGDDGTSDGAQGFNVDFLASLVEAYAVGATQLILDSNGSRLAEVVWGGIRGNGASGGGLSQFYPRPPYQSAYPLGKNGQFWRGVPDLCANGDPESGFLIYVNGQLISVGGTSGSAPCTATCFGVMDYLGINLTHDLLYAHPEWFFDVTSGDNTARAQQVDSTHAVGPRFPAGKGYDVASGMGVLDYSKVIATLKGTSQPTQPTQPTQPNPPSPVSPALRHLELAGVAFGFVPTLTSGGGVCFKPK